MRAGLVLCHFTYKNIKIFIKVYLNKQRSLIMVIKMELKMRLNEAIAESGIKKKYIAKELEVDPNTLSGWITGRRMIPFDKAIHLANIIDCKVDDLYEKDYFTLIIRK
jgi:DNA-binding XRE family transcriptional regulator